MGGPSAHGQKNKVGERGDLCCALPTHVNALIVSCMSRSDFLKTSWKRGYVHSARRPPPRAPPPLLPPLLQAHKAGRTAGKSAREKHHEKKDAGSGRHRQPIKAASASTKAERALASKQQRCFRGVTANAWGAALLHWPLFRPFQQRSGPQSRRGGQLSLPIAMLRARP